MALKALISTKVDASYFRPPPLHIKVLTITECPRVLSWTFKDSTAEPAVVKKNKAAIITDGMSLAKVILYEEFAGRVTEGKSYMMRGHTLRGSLPPYFVNISKGTAFFRASTLFVPEELVGEAESLLHPPSPTRHLRDIRGVEQLVTVTGQIKQMSGVLRTSTGNECIPRRVLTLQQDDAEAVITLWREAAVLSFTLGQQVTISHLRKKDGGIYGLQLQSCNHSKIEIQSVTERNVTVTGVMEDDSSENLQLLLQTGDIIFISKESWEPYDHMLEDTAVQVCVTVKENLVITIKLPTT
ncbi:uncharacterized protein V6R79_002111 [Siganus canaliculatus]